MRLEDVIIFSVLAVSALFTMNTAWRIVLALLVGILGVLTIHILADDQESRPRLRFNLKSPPSSAILIGLHLGVIVAWFLVTRASSLLFIDWHQIDVFLYARGIISLVYTLLVPGILVVRILDMNRRLSRLELAVLGNLFSFAIAALTAYIIFSINISLDHYLFPALWTIATVGIIGNYGPKLNPSRTSGPLRPDSFPSERVALMFYSVTALFLVAVLSVNVTWYALVRGDLWTHVAQTAFFIQGERTISYPWAYHFALSSVWAVSGLPLVNALVAMQFLAILPMFAFFVTLRAYAREDSRLPILGMLFYGCFMGLGWISYFMVEASTRPTGQVSIFGVENLASYLTYDIITGILNIRLLFLPATLSLASVIYAMRLLRGYDLSKPLVFTSALLLTFLSLEAHLFETVFFVAVLALSAILIAERDHINILAICDLGVSCGFLTIYLIDYLSPVQQRLFGFSRGSFYSIGYLYSVDVLVGALILLGLRLFLRDFWSRDVDPLEWIYRKIEPTLTGFENRILFGVCVLCSAVAIALTVYLLTNQPTYFVWVDYASGYVPWQYYPLRIGIVTLLAILGSVLLLLRLSSLRRFLELLLFGVTTLIVSRELSLLGARPLGFGENRVMDILWIALAALAAYGLIEIFPRISVTSGSNFQRRRMLGLVVLVVIIFSGMTSFLILVDAKILDGEYSGYALTAGDLGVADYLLHHPELSVSSVTSPTIQSQRKLMALTLTYPYGYFGDFYIPSVFRAKTIGSFLGQVNSLSPLKIFLGAYDIDSLSSGGDLPALWYLAYQPLIIGADGSYLLSSLSINQPSNNGLIIADEGQPATIDEFFAVSAIALTQNTYTTLPLTQALQSLNGTLLLSQDPTNQTMFNTTYSWVQGVSRTLIVVSSLTRPGLYETTLLKMKDLGQSFNASSIRSLSGASFRIQLPTPLSVRSISYQNATVIAEYSGDGVTTPLAAQRPTGSGRIIFLNLKNYLTALSLNMFTDLGRVLYSFLPSIFLIHDLPLMDNYPLGSQLSEETTGNAASSGSLTSKV